MIKKSNTKDFENMGNTLLFDLGENFHYMQVIAENKLEIKKLEIISKGVQITAKLITITIIGIIGIALFNILVVLAIFLLSKALDSWTLALGTVAITLSIIIALLFIIKDKLSQNISYSISSAVID